MWKVYIIKSLAKKWYYVGSTNRIRERVKEHNDGKVRSTKHYVPFILVYTEDFNSEKEARTYERKLKDCRREKEIILRDRIMVVQRPLKP
ncbi:MAG: GIY-YIG nuclease family protein [Patescibacteria group bacterium]|nr:GIY-YIG nuclease family protein [Patescibacteria group bacterium]